MKIIVVGAGGVGGYFGGRLAAAGYDVTFVARGAHLASIQKNGLKIRNTNQLKDLVLPAVKGVETVAEAGSADLVLIGVKLWDTETVAVTLRAVADKGASFISFQNGVQKDYLLRKYVPAESIIGGVCYIAASISEPGVIDYKGGIQKLVFGEYSGHRSKRCETFLAACKQAGIDAELSDDIERAIWEKFVFLVGLSGATSFFRTTIGPIRDDQQKRAMLQGAMQEVVAVARAKSVNLDSDFAENRLAFCETLPPSFPSSMQIDLSRGNRLELPWLSGAVVDLGRALKVATPVNQQIVEALAPYVEGKQ
jgi:2-dehydropantoate 2-reductase